MEKEKLQKTNEYIESLQGKLTEGRLKVLRRFARMACLEDTVLERIFETMRQEAKWRWSTASNYAGAIVELKKGFMELQKPSRAFKKWVSFIDGQAIMEKKRIINPMTSEHARQLFILLSKSNVWGEKEKTQLLLLFSWVFGQRPSDTAQVSLDDIQKTSFKQHHFLLLTYRRGKTIKHTGPFTLHVESSSPLHLLVRKLSKVQKACGCVFLFTHNVVRDPEVPQSERKRITSACLLALRSLSKKLECRSVRRGGLQRLAKSGMSLHKIRTHFSHHKNEKMLRDYLGFGRYCKHQISSHQKATRWH